MQSIFWKPCIAIAGLANCSSLFASPWSPPALMKDSNNMLHGGNFATIVMNQSDENIQYNFMVGSQTKEFLWK